MERDTYPDLFAVIGTSFGASNGATFRLPDFRGRFLRGVDGDAGRDPKRNSRTAMNPGGNTGDSVGSVQSDQLRNHSHSVASSQSGAGTASHAARGSGSATGTIVSTSTGGSETRPVNANVNFIIKY